MIEVIRSDITTLKVDAIVNAANEAFRGGGGVDGAIHRAAGPELLRECEQHDRLPRGEAIRTKGYRLPARWIIHTVGPVWRGGDSGEPALLRRAYESAFWAARQSGDIKSIAFPSISTGVFGYPNVDAAKVAVDAMRANEPHFARIIACVFNADDEAIYQEAVARTAPKAGAWR